MHRVGVDGRRDVRVGVAEALADVGQRDAGGEQLRAVGVRTIPGKVEFGPTGGSLVKYFPGNSPAVFS
jgi:hypothetical protein